MTFLDEEDPLNMFISHEKKPAFMQILVQVDGDTKQYKLQVPQHRDMEFVFPNFMMHLFEFEMATTF